MNILLVYPNVMGVQKIPLGLSYISSCLKKAGHNVSLLDSTFGLDREDIFRAGKNVDLVGVTVMTLQLSQASWISEVLKEAYSVPVIWGGNHATVRPAECLQNKFVDMVCVGEGEDAVVELADKLDSRKDISTIGNLWCKKNGTFVQNTVRPLIHNIDALPWPDRDVFDRRHLQVDSGSIVSGSRECAYGCGYCINDHLMRLYKGKGKYVRHRSVDNLLDELEMMRDKYGVRFFEFADETFTVRRKWVMEFCEKYKKKFSLPFIFQTRCDNVDREVLKAIRDAGCNDVSFGIESGNEKFRREVLVRKIDDKTIFDAFKMAKDLGFTVRSFNMVGMPYETEDMILDTIKINKGLKPDAHNVCIFYPFPGTKLGDLCEEKGWIARRDSGIESYYYDTILEMPQLDRFTVLAYQKFFPLYLKMPAPLIPVAARVFKGFLKVTYFVQDRIGSKFLREFLNNLYWLNSALTDIKLFKRLFVVAPQRFVKLLKDKR